MDRHDARDTWCVKMRRDARKRRKTWATERCDVQGAPSISLLWSTSSTRTSSSSSTYFWRSLVGLDQPTSHTVVGLVTTMDHRPRHLWTRRVATRGHFAEFRHVVARCRRNKPHLESRRFRVFLRESAPLFPSFSLSLFSSLRRVNSACYVNNRAFSKNCFRVRPGTVFIVAVGRYFQADAHEWRCKLQTKVHY